MHTQMQDPTMLASTQAPFVGRGCFFVGRKGERKEKREKDKKEKGEKEKDNQKIEKKEDDNRVVLV